MHFLSTALPPTPRKHTSKNRVIHALPLFHTHMHKLRYCYRDQTLRLPIAVANVSTCQQQIPPWLTWWCEDWPWTFVRNSEICKLNCLWWWPRDKKRILGVVTIEIWVGRWQCLGTIHIVDLTGCPFLTVGICEFSPKWSYLSLVNTYNPVRLIRGPDALTIKWLIGWLINWMNGLIGCMIGWLVVEFFVW